MADKHGCYIDGKNGWSHHIINFLPIKKKLVLVLDKIFSIIRVACTEESILEPTHTRVPCSRETSNRDVCLQDLQTRFKNVDDVTLGSIFNADNTIT